MTPTATQAVFADTSWWLALTDPADQYHRSAKDLAPLFEDRRIITSEMIFTELLNGLSGRGSIMRRMAVLMIATIRSHCQVIPQSGRLFDEALTLYAGRLDKAWSLTDCASMAIMTRRGITSVLTHDHHFEQAGFLVLLGQH